MKAVAEVCRQEGASLLIPVAPPNHSIYDAILIDLLPSGCRSLSLGADLTAVLDDKVSAGFVSLYVVVAWDSSRDQHRPLQSHCYIAVACSCSRQCPLPSPAAATHVET